MALRHRLIEVGWSLTANLILLLGVLWWGWPPGNAYLLFWVENAILGAVTLAKLLTVEPRAESTHAVFFCLHYGIFCTVHLVFVLFVATVNGLSLSWWAFGFPVALLVIRYLADLTTGWFLGRERFRTTAGRVMFSPYPRIIVLHVATLLGFGLTLSQWQGGGEPGPVSGLADWLAARGITLTPGALVVGILVGVKLVADVLLALRPAPADPATRPLPVQ